MDLGSLLDGLEGKAEFVEAGHDSYVAGYRLEPMALDKSELLYVK